MIKTLMQNEKKVGNSKQNITGASPATKPIEFDLIHKWNLSPDQIAILKKYQLARIDPVALAADLDHHNGQLEFAGTLYIPIYTHCSRRQIKSDAYAFQYDMGKADDYYYFVSYRLIQQDLHTLAIAVIQPELKKKPEINLGRIRY